MTQMTRDDLSGLLARVAGGDRAAFTAVYRATSAKLYGVIYRILLRTDLADEVLQEVFVKIWDRAGDFDAARASPITWMVTIARNRALDEARKRPTVAIDEAPEALNVASEEAHPLDAIALRQDVRRLGDCLGQLDDERRDIIRLAYTDGLTRDAIAARYGRPTATIKTWLHRSLIELKRCLER